MRFSPIFFALLTIPASASAAPTIDTAQQSGVAGYSIGIFGTGFGATQGSGKVTIVGADASITKWSDTVVEAVVPAAVPGAGQLVITASDATTASSPFEVYAIDPKFLARPADLVNLAYKKPFVIVGTHNDWAGNPADFLGYNQGHGADLIAPVSAAVDLGEALSEDVWFSWYQLSDWYEGGDIPTGYTVDASSDSTTGDGGTWTTLLTVTDNTRKARLSKVTLTGQRWIRWSITAMKTTKVGMGEIRVYKRKAAGGTGIDCIGIYGDSITYADLRDTGSGALYEVIRAGKNDGTVPATYFMGLIGAGTGGLALSSATTDVNSIANAIKLTPDIRFFGIALGTNISNNLRQDMKEGIDQLLAANKVPILARIPDTDNSRGGFGDPTYKKGVLKDIDELAAQYKLIPGPDLYTPFRQNLAAYISDGTHHTEQGGVVERQLWADVFLKSGVYGGNLAPPSDGGAGGARTDGAVSAADAASGGGGGAGGVRADGAIPGTGGSAIGSGGAGADEETAAEPASSCGCRVARSSSVGGALLALLGLLAARRRRGRRGSR